MSIVLLAFVTAGAVFAQSPTPDKLTFTAKSASGKNYNEVKAVNDKISGAVVIPETYNNRPVTEITSRAFANCAINSVTIPASVTTIGQRAFEGCTSLTSVTFEGINTSMIRSGVVGASFPGDLDVAYQANGAGTYTRQAGGTNWRKDSSTASAPNTSLDGWWISASGLTIYIDGNTGYIAHIGSDPTWQDAQKKGYVKTNDQKMRNIRSTGNLTWSMQELGVQYNTRSPNVATGTQWDNYTFIMSADGKTLSENGSVIYTRTLAFQ